LDLDQVIHILVGSTFGLILRLFIKYKSKKNIAIYFNHSLIVNVLSSLFLGISIALSPTNNNLLMFFSVGFLGCFSTFSSFIYELFNLIQNRKYISLIIYYVEVLVLSFLFFCLGNFTTLIFKN
tara:strand:- start:492 stop:863 length:372 start_codon:yes stop_codon:yes gene_type:complete